MQKKYILIAVGCICASLVVTGCAKKASKDASSKSSQPPATPVAVQPVKLGTIAQQIQVVGNLQTLYTVNLSPQTAGRLVNIFVREGDDVRVGQILAQIDPTTAQQEVRQDEANLLSDEAKVSQAEAQYQQAKVAAQVGIQNAKSSLSSAKTGLQKTTVGDQPQEKQQVQDQYLQQQANYQNALAAYNREQDLYKAGAVALADLQNAQTTYNVQKSLLDSYSQAVSLAKQGGRPEDIATAQQTVVQQQQNLQNAYANMANVAVDQQAIAAAKATVAQGEAALKSAQQDLANTNLVSTINGVVAARSQDPGAIAQPGTTVLQIVDLSTMYYQATVSEDQFQQIAPGQTVLMNVDAFTSRTFTGKVTDIFPAASTTDRQFSIRISIPNPTKELRPGMYARGEITTVKHTNVVVVPMFALLPRNQAAGFVANSSSNGIATGGASLPPQMAFVAGSDGKAHEVDVTLGIVNDQSAEITAGLKPGDPLIVTGQGQLQDGDRISTGKHSHGSAAAQPSSS